MNDNEFENFVSSGASRKEQMDNIIEYFNFDYCKGSSYDEVPNPESPEGQAKIRKDIRDYIEIGGFDKLEEGDAENLEKQIFDHLVMNVLPQYMELIKPKE